MAMSPSCRLTSCSPRRSCCRRIAHCRPDGRPLLDATVLGRLPPKCYLVNTAHAGLVDEDALLAVLESGRVSTCATDVFAVEPPPSPLLSHPRVIATPHVGAFTAESVHRATLAAVDNLWRVLEPGAER